MSPIKKINREDSSDLSQLEVNTVVITKDWKENTNIPSKHQVNI